MRRLCALTGDRRIDTPGRLTVRWPNARRPGSSQATADEVV
jgi:hypothetical protein